jgi:response regulator NasT
LKVVIAESDADVRQSLRSALEGPLGHRVVGEATTGAEMVQVVRQAEPDLVLFDIHLPAQNGLDALRQINRERVVAAVALTEDPDPRLLRRAIAERVLAYLIKPVEAHQLGAALRTAQALFTAYHHLSNENASLKQDLENRKLVDRAKGALMKRHHWTEADAFRRLQRGAMKRSTTLAVIARDVLNGVDVGL